MTGILVVGAGVGGLAAAARLAAAGHRVTVCEQAPTIGGKLGLLERDGFRFDTGPSLLTLPQVFEELFDATGGPLTDAVTLERVEPVARYRFADGTRLDASGDLDVMAARLDAALTPGSGGDWRRLLRRAGQIWHAIEAPFLQSPLTGPLDLLRLATRVRDLATIAPHRTLRDLGHTYLRDPRLRILLERYATYAGSDPRRAPAALASIAYAEQAFGAWYVRGGLYRLGEAIRDRALEHGAVVRTDAAVGRITHDSGGVTGVQLSDGERLRADVVVANADAAHLYHDLIDSPAAAPARRALDRTTPSLSGFALLLGVRGRTDGVAHHTVAFPDDYDAEFDAIFGNRAEPVADPTLYVAVPPDPTVAPAGHEAWFVLVNAAAHGSGKVDQNRDKVDQGHGRGQVDWTATGMADRYADRVLDRLAARGLDVRDRVVFRELISPADLARRTRAVGGAIYGTASNSRRAAFLRPANRSLVRGLFLVGGSSHPGGGLPLVALSARIVAGLIGPP